MSRKADITRRVLEVIPAEHQISFDQAISVWWQNIRRDGGLRLTDQGFLAFSRLAELEHYTYALPANQPFTKLMLLKLDRHSTMPYYLSPKKTISFFGSQEAMLAGLYGDLAKYIQNLRR